MVIHAELWNKEKEWDESRRILQYHFSKNVEDGSPRASGLSKTFPEGTR